jgi:TetR/AcrR family transcriptional regulator, copper-responsive repressor
MTSKRDSTRPPGRPRQFNPEIALDRAVQLFWRMGYAAADTATLASEMGVTKPSMYGTFGSKEQLFLAALQRYADTVGAAQLLAITTSASIRQGVHAFFERAALSFSGADGPRGCFHISVAGECAETMPSVEAFLSRTVQAADHAISARFQLAMDEGEIDDSVSPLRRARTMTDLARGLALRGRAGVARAELLKAAEEHAEIVLGRV